MQKKLFILISLFYISHAIADSNSSSDNSNVNNIYISSQGYIQNPYIGLSSKGGTQNIAESQIATQNVAEKWFSDGTWNVIGEAAYYNLTGANNYGYGANIFAQTGQVAGFSFGGLFTIMNPYFSNQINPSNNAQQAQTLPIAKQVTPQELFAEYQYSNIIQVDAGWIGISNSPWLTYYQNDALNVITYQGALININPGAGWLLTAIAINGTQLLGETGFSQQTMYNTGFDYGTGTANVANQGSPATIALGASWTTNSKNLNVRIWGYQFENYADLLYADSTLQLPATTNLNFTIGVQGAAEQANGENILNSSGYGTVNSNTVGLQLGLNYKIFSLSLGYNNVWGPSTAYEGGGIVSPYTYQLANDPLYTSQWMQGLVEKSAGSAYKIAPSLSLLDNNLSITPSYSYYATTAKPSSAEYDLLINYNIPQIKGFKVFGGAGYITQPASSGGNISQLELLLSYLY